MRIIVITLFFISSLSFACGETDSFHFGDYNSGEKYDEHIPSPSTKVSGNTVTIDASFLAKLSSQPSGKYLQEHRAELMYLIAIGRDDALYAGITVFLHLLDNPEYISECDSKRELWHKEELAFAIGRSYELAKALCSLPVKKKDQLVQYYKANPQYYGQNYDPPWMPGNLPCG